MSPDAVPSIPPPRVFHEAQERMALLPNYYAWISSHFVADLRGTVLELGSGAGFVVRSYADRVEKVVAVDLEEKLLDQLAASYPPGKIRTAKVDLSGEWKEIADVKADAAIALDVLEHFQDDGAFVDKIARHLKPGGRAVLKVPGQSRLYGEIDRVSGHYRRYDPEDLRKLMEPRGFRTVRIRHMNAVGAWNYRKKRARAQSFSETFSPAKLRFVNAMIPLIGLVDRLPGVKGLSLVGVFELAR